MYLAETLEDQQGVPCPMVGVLPITVRMRPARICRFGGPLSALGACAAQALRVGFERGVRRWMEEHA